MNYPTGVISVREKVSITGNIILLEESQNKVHKSGLVTGPMTAFWNSLGYFIGLVVEEVVMV